MRRRAGSSRPRPPRCRSASAASGTGTTASAGCATRRSPCSRSSAQATTTRRAHGATGSSVRSPARPRDHSRCTGSRESGASPSSSCRGSTGTRARGRSASATRPARSSSSTSTARSSTRSTRRARRGSRRSTTPGRSADALLELLEAVWRDPDEGIWEVRGPRRHFTHSKVMAWVAFDRAIRIVEEHGREGPVERWLALRDEVHAQVCREGFHEGMGAFTQSYGSDRLDASLLLMPARRLPPGRRSARRGHRRRDRARPHAGRPRRAVPRRRGQHRRRRAPARRGGVPALLVLARRGDGAPGPDATEAEELLERLLALRNDLGPPRGGVRRRSRPAGRELPAGVHAPCARQRRPHGVGPRRPPPRPAPERQRCPKWWARGSAATTSGVAATRRASGERLSSSRTRMFRLRSTRS